MLPLVVITNLKKKKKKKIPLNFTFISRTATCVFMVFLCVSVVADGSCFSSWPLLAPDVDVLRTERQAKIRLVQLLLNLSFLD